MTGGQDFDSSIEVRVWDTPDNSKSDSGNDEYTLLVVDGEPKFIARFYTDSNRPRETIIKTDNLQLDDIPSNIASVMQEYIDDSEINWPDVYGSRQGQIRRERSTITIQHDNDRKYQFEVFDQDLVRITDDEGRVSKESLPGPVLAEAQEYIPGDPEYIPAP